MDRASVPPTGFREKAICLPEVLASVFSWLRDERHTLRSARLVSKQFLATANQFFRIHLTADYAIEHNCIQEAAAIIGGLALTFPRIIPKELDILNRHLGLEPQDSVVTLDFCSMVARNCVHLETIKIVLEGPYSEEISQLLSCLFSQNPESAAVFRVKSLEFRFGLVFVDSVIQDLRDHIVPDSCNGLLPATDYIPAESAFSRLEKLSLAKGLELSLMYRILRLRICPEVAAATLFLGPVFWNRMERAVRLPTASLTAKPSRTLKTFKISSTLCSVNELYALQEQAPGLEEVHAMSTCNTDESFTNEVAFARDSTRSPGTLHLKRLFLFTTMDRKAKLLLCRLLDISVLESFVANYIIGHREQAPPVGNNAEGFLTQPLSSNTLNEILDEMTVDSISGRQQRGFLREFGFSSYDGAVERVDWLQRLKDTPRLYRLENLSLPLNLREFLQMFDKSVPLTVGRDNNSSSALTTTTTAVATDMAITVEGRVLGGLPQQSMPFPSCSSLLSIHIGGSDHRNQDEMISLQFADYLIRCLPRLEHLEISRCKFTDLIFLNAIAPPALRPPGPSSSSSSLPSPLSSLSHTSGKSVFSQEGHCSNSNTGLYRLESLTISFEFMRDDLFARDLEESSEFDLNWESQPVQVHEDRVEQFLAVLDRFQRKKRENWFINDEHLKSDSADPGAGVGVDVAGLKRVTIHQTGMPEVYVERLKASVASQFPELDFKMSSRIDYLVTSSTTQF